MTLHGAGASTCRDFAEIFDAFRPFLKETAHDAVAQRCLQCEQWIEGYIFGMETNIRNADVLRDWDEVGMREWIYGFCQKHPSEIVANAALAFFEMRSGAADRNTDGKSPNAARSGSAASASSWSVIKRWS